MRWVPAATNLLGDLEGSRIPSSCSFLKSVLSSRLCRQVVPAYVRDDAYIQLADKHEIPTAGLGSRRSFGPRSTGAENTLKQIIGRTGLASGALK